MDPIVVRHIVTRWLCPRKHMPDVPYLAIGQRRRNAKHWCRHREAERREVIPIGPPTVCALRRSIRSIQGAAARTLM